ncbi:MAG: folate-binding protein YgfZ [Rhodospirillales bacterium]|nr:MAG: folate-binding protein YgfZ [Rhodospirillales bacterium]
MTKRFYTPLAHRGVLTVGGTDRREFLQGLVSNDVMRVDAGHALWSAFLTPQGKYLHDFFIAEVGEALCLDCEGHERLMDLGRRLHKFKLRSAVELGIADHLCVLALWGDDVGSLLGVSETPGAARAMEGGVVYIDPRLVAAGARAILPADRAAELLEGLGFAAATPDDYDRMRLELGLPDGSKDLVVEKSILLESNFDALNGVDWDKGCYMGQELTARTRYRGLVKKRLMPVAVSGEAPAPGVMLMRNGKEAGEMRSSRDGLGLALIRLEHVAADGQMPTFEAGSATLTLREAPWQIPEPQS